MLSLSDPTLKVPYIGETQAKRLSRMGILTVSDLLHHFPFRYEDYANKKPIRDVRVGEKATVEGEVWQIQNIRTRYGKFLTKAIISDSTGTVEAVWFNQPYLTRNIKSGQWVAIAGELTLFGGKPTFVSPDYEALGKKQEAGSKKPEGIHTGRLVPVYPETSRITSKWLRTRIYHLLEGGVDLSDVENLPSDMRERQDIIGKEKALRGIHFPDDQAQIKKARKRLSFEELFFLILSSLKKGRDWKKNPVAKPFKIKPFSPQIRAFIRDLPFRLTSAQAKAVNEILSDLEKDYPMNRLLEGDVGSGKTVVAAVAIYLAYLNGVKSILMAPTEILADQHLKTLTDILAPKGVKIAIHTGSKKSEQPNYQTTESPNNRITNYNLWVGTHALFYRKERYQDVGLLVIDEQHRFGVEQRAKLLERVKKMGFPHVLTLTATPIPRTLAFVLYGDLSLSILDEMPPGRIPVQTWVVPREKRGRAYHWIRKQIKEEKSQTFVICPLIEESEVETMKQVKAAKVEYEKLQKIFPDLKIGLLHGRLKAKEKEEVIGRFRKGDYDILVSTPVVEVGIDVPNATIMVVEAAERFGLASLHQLRGRVGRGSKPSFCLLFHELSSSDIVRRLKAMERISSGFVLSELDLKMRGPGELSGTKQHGFVQLKIAKLSDAETIKKAKEEAMRMLKLEEEKET